jgi:diguanylate cyclase (GGDEF)-like protein
VPLIAAIERLASATSLREVQEVVRTAVRDVAGCDGATFVLRDGDQCYYADEDAIAPLWKGLRFPMEACISGWAMLNGSVAVIPDIYADPRIPHDAYRPTFVRSLAMMPIRASAPIGALGAYWASEHEATAGEVWMLRAVAEATSLALEKVSVQEELHREVELSREAHRLSQTDELTGALNRRGFVTDAEAQITSARQPGTPPLLAAVAFVDINGLKTVNDTDGHHAGDRVVVSVVDALRGAIRPGDVIGRMGGDEFAVFATGVDASVLRDRLTLVLGDMASVGCVVFGPESDLSEALLAADADMYAHKRQVISRRSLNVH